MFFIIIAIVVLFLLPSSYEGGYMIHGEYEGERGLKFMFLPGAIQVAKKDENIDNQKPYPIIYNSNGTISIHKPYPGSDVNAIFTEQENRDLIMILTDGPNTVNMRLVPIN